MAAPYTSRTRTCPAPLLLPFLGVRDQGASFSPREGNEAPKGLLFRPRSLPSLCAVALSWDTGRAVREELSPRVGYGLGPSGSLGNYRDLLGLQQARAFGVKCGPSTGRSGQRAGRRQARVLAHGTWH